MKVKIFILLIMVPVLLQAGPSFGDEGKMYNYYQLKYKINDKFDAFIQPDMRFNDNIRELYYYHFRNCFTYHALKNLDLGATYRFAKIKNSRDKWLDEHRLELEATPKVTLGDLKLANRSRFEHRWLQSYQDRWRYRNRSKIAYAAKIGDFEFTPYISEEIFYDFEIEKLHMNWATAGIDKRISKNLLLGLFYLNEVVRSGETDEWNTNHYIGTKVVVSL